MEETNKMNQTPEETAEALSDLAEKLKKMDRAKGAFGESMGDALPDEYLEEIAGGFQRSIPRRQAWYQLLRPFAACAGRRSIPMYLTLCARIIGPIGTARIQIDNKIGDRT